MVVQDVLCMVGGTGETSYANNSMTQRIIIGKVGPLFEESIKAICSNLSPECLTIADLGCSSGPNALAVVESVIDVAVSSYRSSGLGIPEFNVFLNDLPQNDFNTIFKLLPGFQKKLEEEKGVGIQCCVSGAPGSFYGRLFPTNLFHLMHSSSSLHWLSQVPKGVTGEDGEEALNKGSIYGRKGSSEKVLKAYKEQFGRDFTRFLRCRSKELVERGRLVLTFVATHDDEPIPVLEFIGQGLYKLASQGRIEKKKVDGFNLPYYNPTVQQVKHLIEADGSFAIHKLDTVDVSLTAALGTNYEAKGNTKHDEIHVLEGAKFITKTFRGVFQPLLASEFGEDIIHQVFCLHEDMMVDYLTVHQEIVSLMLVISLIRKP